MASSAIHLLGIRFVVLSSHSIKALRSHSANQLHEIDNFLRNPCTVGAEILFEADSQKECEYGRDDKAPAGYKLADLADEALSLIKVLGSNSTS